MGSHRRTASGRALSCALVFVVASALALAACGGSTPPGADSPKAGDRGAAKKAMPSPKPEYLSNDKRARRKPAGPAPETGDLGAWLDLEDPSGHALDAFHARLAATAQGEGKTRLLFFGASHVASDLFTRIVRSDLQREFGDGGRGWVLPVHAWRYYRPLGLSLESNGRRWKSRFVKISKPEPDFYGLAGVYMESTRAGDHGALTTHASATAADFELHYLAQPRGGDVDVFLDGKRLSRLRTKGAAKGVSSATFAVPAGEHRFEVRTVGNGPVRLFGVEMEGEEPGVVVDALGVNGARAKNQLWWDDASFRAELAKRDPALVALAYGTNESGDDDVPIETYEGEVRRVLARVKEAAPGASCLLIGPSDRPLVARDGTATHRPRTDLVIETQRRISKDMGCAFVDMAGYMGGPLSILTWASHDPPLAAKDHIHLTVKGYERFGHALSAALLRGTDGIAHAHPATGTARRPANDEAANDEAANDEDGDVLDHDIAPGDPLEAE